jgi:hypothetical protein
MIPAPGVDLPVVVEVVREAVRPLIGSVVDSVSGALNIKRAKSRSF